MTTAVTTMPAFPNTIDEMVNHYVRLRDTLKIADDKHKEKTAAAREYLENLNGAIVAKLSEIGVESAKTEYGTAYRTVTKSATVADGALFRKFIIDTKQYDLVDMRANAPAIEVFISGIGQGNPPPGVNYSTMVKAGVRRA